MNDLENVIIWVLSHTIDLFDWNFWKRKQIHHSNDEIRWSFQWIATELECGRKLSFGM